MAKAKEQQMQQQEQQSVEGSTNGEPAQPAKRKHRATYSTDKRKGGYLVRVQGPNAARFVGRTVPVTRRDGSENPEQLEKLIWTGLDVESGEPCALYAFTQKPRQPDETEF